MSAADCWPGPTNQKSVPGPSQRAVTRPPESVCSASSPCDIDPVAETMTPPRPGAVATELPAVFCADPGLPGGAAASGTDVVASLPGRLRLPTTAPAVALPGAGAGGGPAGGGRAFDARLSGSRGGRGAGYCPPAAGGAGRAR